MKRLTIAVLMLLLGLSLGGRLLAGAPRPSLAILPLKEEGRKTLGDVSDTMNMLVASAFTESGAFRLVERGQVLAALPDGKLQDSSAITDLGQRLGAKFILMGSYLPEYTLVSGTVTVTMTLRLVNAADGTVFKNFQEIGAGASLGAVVASLTRQLSAKAAAAMEAGPAPVLAAPPVVAAPSVPAAPQAVAAPQAADLPPVPAAPQAAAPAAVPQPVEAAAPSPRKAGKALVVLREGTINGIYYQKGGLARFGAKLEDFEFLVKTVAKLFPAGVDVSFDIGTRGWGDDVSLNKALVGKYQPDTFVVMTLECRTETKGRYVVFSKTLLQADVRVDFLAPDTLGVIASRTVQTEYVPSKGLAEAFPPELKAQLAERLAAGVTALPQR